MFSLLMCYVHGLSCYTSNIFYVLGMSVADREEGQPVKKKVKIDEVSDNKMFNKTCAPATVGVKFLLDSGTLVSCDRSLLQNRSMVFQRMLSQKYIDLDQILRYTWQLNFDGVDE